MGLTCEKSNTKPIYHAEITTYSDQRYSVRDTTIYYDFFSVLQKAGRMMDLEKQLKTNPNKPKILRLADKRDGKKDNLIYLHNLEETIEKEGKWPR